MSYHLVHRSRQTGRMARALALAASFVVVMVISASRAGAQAPGEAGELPLLSSQPLGGKENTLAIAVGDLNTDGHLDLVTGGGTSDAPGPNRVYFNDGTGQFGAAGLVIELTPRGATQAVALADLNGDGTLDIVFGNLSAQNEVYFNDGLGNLAAAPPFGPAGDETAGLAVGDLDGDGALDVVVANTCWQAGAACAPVRVYLNDAQGGLSESEAHTALVTARAQGAGAVALADLDRDGDLDLLVGHQGAPNEVYLNDGHGALAATPRTFGGDTPTGELIVGDVDGDGDLDVVEINTWRNDVVYHNDGSGGLDAAQEIVADPGVTVYAEIAAGVLADVDGDGDLDLVAGTGGSEVLEENVVLLNDGSGRFDDILVFGSPNTTAAVAVADLNDDGVLDIVSADYQEAEVWVYLRQPMGLVAPAVELTGVTGARDAVMGDVNGDGLIDVVLVRDDGQHVIYVNDGKCILDGSCPTLSFGAGRQTRTLALADLDGDDDLDIVEGNDGRNYLYRNPGTTPFTGFPTAVSLGSDAGDTQSLAIADVNGDGHLDVVAGNIGQNYVYLNDAQGRGRFDRPGAARAFGTGSDVTLAVAGGDLNQDGYPDLVVGNGAGTRDGRYHPAEQNRIYYNDGRGFFGAGQPLGRPDNTAGVALADLNRDGSLDVVVVNDSFDRNQVYYNDGTGGFGAGEAFGAFGPSIDVSIDDLDGDGDLDLLVGERREVWAHLNSGTEPFDESPRLTGRNYGISATALGDLDGDGMPDVLVVRGGRGYTLLNRARTAHGLPDDPPTLAPGYPTSTHQAGLTFSPRIVEGRYLTIPLTLSDQESDPVGQLVAFYSLDGGGRWLPAVSKQVTATTWLSTSPDGEAHMFVWDTLASGVFGRSDDVVVRFVAYAQPPAGAAAGTFRYVHGLPAPTQWPASVATTRRFRMQGTQVQVIDHNGKALEGAYVYRLPQGLHSGAQLMPDPAGPLTTDARGFLPGRGVLGSGDGLVALLPVTPTRPITFTQQATLYHTSAAPDDDGLEMTEVTDVGIIQLTIPSEPEEAVNPLLLFDLLVSVEWDPATDEVFMLELEEGFRRASELLYDVSNGQVALGQVHLAPGKAYWNRADVTIYATNGMRPSAALGGVVNAPVGEWVRPGYALAATQWVDGAYLPGQVRMGTSWDPFGEDTSDLGEQWWRALAHELGHHLFFLPDNYVGLKPDDPADPGGKRYLGRIDCRGSLMTTTRDPSYSEFLTEGEWTGECVESLAENTTGRTDWQTVTHFYPMLKEPAVQTAGPSILPLDVTHLTAWWLPAARVPLPTRIFDLRDRSGEHLRLPNAGVYLFQTQGTADPTDDVLVSLGSPTGGGDRIKVRGAYAGDRLCLYDFQSSDRTYTGCADPLTATDVSIRAQSVAQAGGQMRWAPAVDVRAVTTRTLDVR
ncbi:MAG TPA: VCBS repeat-containing protein, partial [Anaerolineae bacterium]|nr:VCBS repeat-containing protein [Anaerolineae bacterium]